jgi:hypothetical protein
MGRGSNNLNYDDGFSMREKIIRFPVLKNILEQNQLEETSRTLIDIATGTMHTHKYKETFTVLVYE